MKNFGKVIVGCVVSLSLASSLQARDFADIYTECGLGAMIAPSNKPVAAITNVVWDLGTTAVSSNITSDSTCLGKSEKVASFINSSYGQLENEIAMGEGKYLDSLVSMAKPSDISKEIYVSNLRKNFSNLVASNDYTTMSDFNKSEKLYNIVY